MLVSADQLAVAQEHVSFPTEDGGVAYAEIYGQGERVVVLAHGGPLQQGELGKAGTGVLSDFLSVRNTLPIDSL